MLECKDLSVGYGKKAVLDGVCVQFRAGSLTSLIGVNGCGKSTLLRAAVGLLPTMRGEITLDGVRLSDRKRGETAKRIAYLAQGRSTPDMTVYQLVLHGRFPHLSYPRRYAEKDRRIAREAMESVGIAHLADKPLHTLSGGMRQTAYIAMALAQDTDYILLDEPTTYLDIPHQIALMRLLRTLADSGKGIVTVMHDLPLAFGFSDFVALLEGGRIPVSGTPEQVCSAPEIEQSFGIGLLHQKEENAYRVQYR